MEHGVAQGDVISPYIFTLAVELLLIKINNTKDESRSETFADDTSICIRRDPRYLGDA